MTGKGITTEELVQRIRTRPHDIGPYLADPESAPLLLNTLREAMALIIRRAPIENNVRRIEKMIGEERTW